MTNPIIRVSHLTYRYPSAKRAVIDDLSFTIARGETVALMGVNGSGKSTLVRMLCALTAPTAGSIEVAGVPVASTGKRGRNVRPKSANRKQLAQLRRHVGYVMQHPEHQLFADTVAEDVAYGPRNQGLGETEVADRVRESLELLHIGHLADIFQHPVASCHYYIHSIPQIPRQVSAVNFADTELRSPEFASLPSDGYLVRSSFSRIPGISPNGPSVWKTGRGIPEVSFGILHAMENGIFLECSLEIAVYIQKVAGAEQ